MELTNRGFTLIEVLISITLLSVILVLMFGGLRIGINAWETGEKNLDAQQHQQVVLDLMRRQLASAKAETIDTADDRQLLFNGKPTAVAFISSHAIMPGNIYGDVYVQYWIEDAGDQFILKIYENNTVFESLAGDMRSTSRTGTTYELAAVRDLRFSYLTKDESRSYWSDNWDPEARGDEKLPAAIRCVFQINKHMPPIEMFVATKASTLE